MAIVQSEALVLRSHRLGETSLIVTLWLAVPPALLAVQVKVMPIVSLVMLCVSQPLWLLMADSESLTFQLTVTSLTYQPLLPSVPLILGAITGAVLSCGST